MQKSAVRSKLGLLCHKVISHAFLSGLCNHSRKSPYIFSSNFLSAAAMTWSMS